MSFGKKASTPPDPTLFGIDVSGEPTNQEATPLLYVAGEYVIPASYTSPAYNQRAVNAGSNGAKTGKGGSSGNKTYNYYATFLIVWHAFQCDKLTGIIIDDRLQWSGLITRPTDGSLYTDVTIDGRGIYRHYWGTTAQITIDPHLVASANDYGDDHPAYNGFCYGILIDFLCGQNKTQAPAIKLRGERTPIQPFFSGTEAQNDDGQANPFCVLAELLTNTWFGLGQPLSWFSAAKWVAAIEGAYARRALCYCSPLVDQQTSVKSIATDLFVLCDGFLRSEDGTGLIEAGLFALPESIDPTTLPTLDSQSLVGTPSFSPESWNDVSNSWKVNFRNRDYVFKNDAVKDFDLNGLQIIGEERSESLDCKGIVRLWQAQNYAAEYKRRHAVPGCPATIKVRAELVEDVQPGHHVRTDIDPFPGGLQLQQVFRVYRISRDTKGSAELALDEERTLAPIAYLPSVAPAGPQIPADLPEIGQVRLFEAPWKNYAIGVLASRPSQIVTDFSTYYDNTTSGSFPFMGKTRSYALPAKMHAQINDTSTAPIVVDLVGTTNRELISSDPGDTAARDDTLLMIIMRIGGDGQILADSNNKAWIEVLSCRTFTVSAANQVTVSVFRSRQTTIARAFYTNDEVWFVRRSDLPVIVHADFPGLALNAANAYFKLQPSTMYAERDLADCAVHTFNFSLNRDIPPEVVLGTVSFGGGFSSTTDVTVGSLAITGTGGRRRIVIDGLANNPTPNAETITISLYRDSTKIATIAVISGLLNGSTEPFSYAANDNPTDGAHTYYVKIRTDNSSSSANIGSATMTIT